MSSTIQQQIEALGAMLADAMRTVTRARAMLDEIKATMQAGPEPPPDPAPEPQPEPDPSPLFPEPRPPTIEGAFPDPLRVISIPDADTLRRTLGNDGPMGSLQAGDRLKCAAFTTEDPIVVGPGAGTRDNPIVVEGVPGTRFVGKVELVGPWSALLRIAAGNGVRVRMAARGVRMSRCTIEGATGDIVAIEDGMCPDASIDLCAFKDFSGPAIAGIARQADKSRGLRIVGNLFAGHSVRGDAEHVICLLTNAFVRHDMLIRGNRFERCMNGASTQRELLCIKTMGVTIQANTLIDCNRGFISLRETQNCVVERNWLESGSMINVHGRGHIIRGNVSDDIVAMVNGGNAYFGDGFGPDPCKLPSAWNGPFKWGVTLACLDGSVCKPAHAAADACLLEGNVGRILVGKHSVEKGMPARNNTFRGNSHRIELIEGPNGHAGSTETGVGTTLQPRASKLSLEDVGPNAPWSVNAD